MSVIRNALSRGERLSIVCGGGRTKQAMRDECDINTILRKFLKSGTIAHVSRYGAMYGDFSPLSLQEALNLQIEASAMFAALPAKVRKRFANDPMEFLTFVQDEKNAEALVELGLAERRPEADMSIRQLSESILKATAEARPANPAEPAA